MSGSEGIEQYLGEFRLRLQRLNLSRGLAAIAVAVLLITVVAVALAIRSGFPDGLVLAARLGLLATIVGLAFMLIVRPNRRLAEDGIDSVEARAPAFDGRLRTWADSADSQVNPLRELLAEDALRVAEDATPEQRIPIAEFRKAIGTGSVALAALLLLGIAGPGNYGYGIRDLWLGWLLPGIAPPQSIAVTPGDGGIRAGGTVRVRAETLGFAPGEATVHARFGNDDWQEVVMAGGDSAFEFTFFSVREPLDYYVSAAGVRSPEYRISVVDLPGIERLTNTYRWPEWTGRDEETRDPGGDVRAVAETVVGVDITATDALTPTVLIVDDEEFPLDVDGENGSASFTVAEDGQYYVAAVVGGERIRLTDDYFITVLEDEQPVVEILKPGRDWSASSIEEVSVRVSARDDFRVESLELRYSVNGGDWNSVPLSPGDEGEAEHVLMLESLLADQVPVGVLVPGDLVSYYAVAGDRVSTARTDIFFVDVQPFDRRYTQSQMAGGAAGQQGGNQNEISQRQREIIVSTWNLIREQQEERRDDAMYVPDNAALLARLQETLREQARTLAQRTRARMLAASDEQIAEFVENLELAAEAMIPAAERLAAIELEDAILPEQEALQHLLRAEAVFNDINVSMQANRGGGGQAGRDLSDMFELEMDLEKNQYETGSRATPDAPPQQQLDDIGNELEELARRQEQLANRMNSERQPTPAQRWQQDLLRRQTEELQQRLERMQQQNAQSSAQNQQGGEPSQGQPGGSPSSAEGSESSEGQRQMEQLRRRLDSALRAMNDADTAMRDSADPGESQRAAAEAQRQLEGARDQASEERERLAQAELAELGERATAAYDAQSQMEQQLQDAIRRSLSDDDNDDRLESGMTFGEEMAMARRKRELQSELQQLEQDIKRSADELADDSPQAADELERAMRELREDEVDTRLAIAANYIEIGEAVYVSGSESAVTEALREFAEGLRRAGELAASGGDPAFEEPGLESTLADTRAVRRQLQALAESMDPANSGNPAGQPAGSGRDDRPQSTGIEVGDLEGMRDFGIDFDNLSDAVLSRFRDLRASGVAPRDLDELRRLAAEVRAADFSGNPELLEREARAALSLVEQIELALARAARAGSEAARATPAEQIADEHREPVATYFRRLAEADDETD